MKFFNILRRRAVAIVAIALLTALQPQAGIVNELPTIRVSGKIMYYYDTQSGDNIYTIADKLGVSVGDIRAYNPSVSDGVKPRMRLFFPTDIATNAPGDSQGPLTHVVAKGESIYGIAHSHGLTMDQLVSLNPAAKDGIKPGMRLRLREDVPGNDVAVSTPQSIAAQDIPAQEPAGQTSSSPLSEPTLVADSEEDTVSAEPGDSIEASTGISSDTTLAELHVAVILPFLLEEENIGRQTKLYTEFYKGFLIAADSLNLPGRTPVRLHAYDSSANLDSVQSIMRRPEMASMSLIIAPDNQSQLGVIAREAPSDALVFNMFAVRDSSYKSNRTMVQTNIPHDAMYARAIDGFFDRFPEATPVFISRTGGRTDKEEFTDQLKQRLSMAGRVYKTLSFDNYLSDADLEGFDPDTNEYVFIPLSGSRDEFTRILHALKGLKGRGLNPDAVQVFGYPEWATFRGTQFDEICDLGTTIYSRYSPVERDADAERVNEAFRHTYGEGMIDKQMPVLGILGFDTGTMVIEGLRTMAGTGEFPSAFEGIQSGIRLVQTSGDSGLYNDALFIITYRPGGLIEKTLK